MYNTYALFRHRPISDQWLLCTEIWVEAIIAGQHSRWKRQLNVRVSHHFHLGDLHVFWLTLITGNRSVCSKIRWNGQAHILPEARLTIQQCHLIGRWEVPFFRLWCIQVLWEKHRFISCLFWWQLHLSLYVKKHRFFIWNSSSWTVWSAGARLYRKLQLQVITTLHAAFGWMTSWCFLRVGALCFGTRSIQVILEQVEEEEGKVLF